jgi:hypothetical protein
MVLAFHIFVALTDRQAHPALLTIASDCQGNLLRGNIIDLPNNLVFAFLFDVGIEPVAEFHSRSCGYTFCFFILQCPAQYILSLLEFFSIYVHTGT